VGRTDRYPKVVLKMRESKPVGDEERSQPAWEFSSTGLLRLFLQPVGEFVVAIHHNQKFLNSDDLARTRALLEAACPMMS